MSATYRRIMVTQKQFAIWSFNRDLESGCFDGEVPPIVIWLDLSQPKREAYLAEARTFLQRSISEWPKYILEKL